jgi:hypothetical protein
VCGVPPDVSCEVICQIPFLIQQSVFGFFVGSLVTGGLAYTSLAQDIQRQNHVLLTSLEDLAKMTAQIKREHDQIQSVEREWRKFKADTASTRDLQRVEATLMNGYDQLLLSVLDGKARLSKLEAKAQGIAA